MGQIEKDMIRESVRVRLLQLLDINFIDNIVTSPIGKGNRNENNENNSSSILQAISSKFGNNSEKLKLNSELSGYEDIGWNEELRIKFEKLVKLSTFDDTDPVLSRGLNLMNDHLIGRNNGLYNALTKFFQHDNQQHQGIELYKLINEYYKFIQKQTGRSLISSKWDEVISAIGRLMEQIKRIELSNCSEGLNLHMELNASICSFSSTGTQASLVTSQKEVIEASQLFFQLIPEKHRIEIRSMLAFLRVCSCVGGGHLSIDQIVMDFVNVVFDSSGWPNQAYKIHETGEYFNYANQILTLWIENNDSIIELPSELGRQIKLKFELIKKGQLSPCAPDYKFCQAVTNEVYNEQKSSGTQSELAQLARSIENSNIPQKKKDKLFEQLRTMHGL